MDFCYSNFISVSLGMVNSSTHLLNGADNGFPIIVMLLVFAFFFSAYFFTKRNRVLRGLKESASKKIKDFADGDRGKIIGRIDFAGETVIAPLSKRKCAYYYIKVEEYRNNGKHRSWHTVIEEEQYGDVVISDGTGFALVDVGNSLNYLVEDAAYQPESTKSMKPELRTILDRHNVSPDGFFGFSKTLRCSEGILAKGEKVIVSGEGQWNETKDHKLNIPTSKVLVIIPDDHAKLYLTDDPEAAEETEM